MELKAGLEALVAIVVILALWVVVRGMWHTRRQAATGAQRPPAWVPEEPADFDTLVRAVRGELARNAAERIDWTRPVEDIRRDVRLAVEHLIDVARPLLNHMERERIIDEVVDGIRWPESVG